MKKLFVIFAMMFGCAAEVEVPEDTNTEDTNTEDTDTEETEETEDIIWGCMVEEMSTCFDMFSSNGWTLEEAEEACDNNEGVLMDTIYGCEVENVAYECTVEVTYEITIYYYDDYWTEEEAELECADLQ